MKRIKMYRINLIDVEWNCHNGLIMSVLRVELDKPNIDSGLLGIYVSRDFLYLDILFIKIRVFDKNEYGKHGK